MEINENGCPFCNEFNGKEELSFFRNNIGTKNHIMSRCVLETVHFSCVPSIGSFLKGYLLIIPKEHFLSVLSMPTEYIAELEDIISAIAAFYMHKYSSDFIFFEHGSSDTDNIGGMSVTHAHLHIIPFNEPLINKIKEFDFINYANIFDAQNAYLPDHKNPYLLLRDTTDSVYYCEAGSIPSQFFRNIICDSIGLTGMGNWKQYPFIENIKATLNDAAEYDLKNFFGGQKWNKNY